MGFSFKSSMFDFFSTLACELQNSSMKKLLVITSTGFHSEDLRHE